MLTPVIGNYHVDMRTQLLLDLGSDSKAVAVHFCEASEIDSIIDALSAKNIAVFSIDGSLINGIGDLYRAFAIALKMPNDWYGPEEYAPNADAFHEYLDDVHEWVPASGHVVVIRHAERLWREQARVAGFLTEMWQFSVNARGQTIIWYLLGNSQLV